MFIVTITGCLLAIVVLIAVISCEMMVEYELILNCDASVFCVLVGINEQPLDVEYGIDCQVQTPFDFNRSSVGTTLEEVQDPFMFTWLNVNSGLNRFTPSL